METFEKIEGIFDIIVNYLILFVELIGILILIYAVVSAVIGLFRRQQHVRLKLAEGIALSLEFKMGGELLRTVIVREWKELLILGAIILMRAALTFLIQWEIKIERKSGNMSDSQLKDIKTPLTQDIKNKTCKFSFRRKATKNETRTNENREEDKPLLKTELSTNPQMQDDTPTQKDTSQTNQPNISKNNE